MDKLGKAVALALGAFFIWGVVALFEKQEKSRIQQERLDQKWETCRRNGISVENCR